MAERTCIPFKTIQFNLSQGTNFADTLTKTKKVATSLKSKVFDNEYLQTLTPTNRLIHNLAYTAFGLTLIVGYEYTRFNYPELNLPALEPAIPAASLTPPKHGQVTGHDIEVIDKLREIGNFPGVDKDALDKRTAEMMNQNLEERGKKK